MTEAAGFDDTMRDALRRGAIGDAIGHEEVWLSELSDARAASDSFSRDIRYDGDKWIRYPQLPNCRVSRVMSSLSRSSSGWPRGSMRRVKRNWLRVRQARRSDRSGAAAHEGCNVSGAKGA